MHSNRLWPGLVLVLILMIGYFESNSYLENDVKFVEDLYSVGTDPNSPEPVLTREAYAYLRLRPLLKVTPAPGDWDFRRILIANFVHGSSLHLILNLIGAFAGARICATFLPFLCTLSIFILGGSFGFLVSLLFSTSGYYVPHVGASAGIFAMMGTYYVYNFRYRTRYFFISPSRRANTIALNTATFFFVDAILLELLLSAAQLVPQVSDGVDHLAHVFGFGAGMALAYALRFIQRWPNFLQTRGEFLIWVNYKNRKEEKFDTFFTPFNRWVELLEMNPYNDWVKEKLFRLLYNHCHRLNQKQLEKVFTLISPTYVRLHGEEASVFIREVLSKNITVPDAWFKRMPYDSIIQLAKHLSRPVEEQHLLLKLVAGYRKNHGNKPDTDRKLELLLGKLSPSANQRRSAN